MLGCYPRFPWGRNHKCEQPSRLIFVDTETCAYPTDHRPWEYLHRLRLGVASAWLYRKSGWARIKKLHFTETKEFWSFSHDFYRKSKPTWTFAHNMAFDFTILGGWGQIDSGRLRIREETGRGGIDRNDAKHDKKTWAGKMAIEGAVFIVEARTDEGPVKFIDTYNYWRVPLWKLGKQIGLEKLDMPDWGGTADEMFTYCQRDVEIIEKAVIRLLKFWKENNLGNWQTTVSGLAYSSFRHGKESAQIVAHGDRKISVDERRQMAANGIEIKMDPFEVSELELRSYFGGRRAVFYTGDIITGALARAKGRPNMYDSGRAILPGPVWILDVNSLYPFVMANFDHPTELLDAIPSVNRETAMRLIEEFPCIADVEVRSDDYGYPSRIAKGVGYFQGCIRTTLAHAELRAAVKRGSVQSIANLACYYAGRPFTGYVDIWHRKRRILLENGNEVDAGFCKMMLNNLYGKLAQRTPSWVNLPDYIPPIRWGGFIGNREGASDAEFMRAIGGLTQVKSERRSCLHTFTAAAASVTAQARVYMQSLIDLCPYKSILYMDTDSLFCLEPAYNCLLEAGMIDQLELGKLKLKGRYDNVTIHGPQDYELDGERIISGLKADAKELSERLWQQINFEGAESIISSEPDDSVGERKVLFQPSSTPVDYGIDYDGWTKPLRVT